MIAVIKRYVIKMLKEKKEDGVVKSLNLKKAVYIKECRAWKPFRRIRRYSIKDPNL